MKTGDPYKRGLASLHEFHEAHPTYKVALAVISGSHAFGWNSETSDCDIRGCYIVPTEDFFTLEEPPSTIEMKCEEYNTEFQMHEIKKFVGLEIQPNLNMLDAVFTKPELILEKDDKIYKELCYFGNEALSKAAYPHVQGLTTHMRLHRSKYNIFDAKKSLYIYRELMRGIYLFETGKIINNISDLADEMPEYKKTVDMLLDKKRKKVFLSDDEVENVKTVERDLESRMLSAKEFGTLRERPKDSLRKEASKFLKTTRRNNYDLQNAMPKVRRTECMDDSNINENGSNKA